LYYLYSSLASQSRAVEPEPKFRAQVPDNQNCLNSGSTALPTDENPISKTDYYPRNKY